MRNRSKPGIPSKRKAGKGLQDHSALLEQIIDFLPDPTFAIDRDGKVILWNKAMEDFTHVTAASMIGKSEYEYAIPFYGRRRPMLVDLIFRPDEEIEKEYDFIQHEHDTLVAEGPVDLGGLQRHIWGKAGPIYDTQGTVIGAIESVRDITERRKTDEALQQSEAKYRDIFLNVSDLLYLHDLNGNFIETNLASKKETGYTENDLEHLSVYDILPDRHRHRFKNYINNVVKNGSDEGFLTIKTKTGDERILEYRNSLITDPDGKPLGVRGSARDITARIRAQKQLRKERDLTTAIIETSPAFFDAVDPHGRTIMMNQAMLRSLGYTQDEVLGRDYRDMFIPEEERQAYSAAFEELVSSGRPVVHENKVLTRDGGIVLVQWHSRAVFRGDGKLDFLFGIGIDISEHKRAEEALRKSEENFRTIFENATEGIYQTIPEGRYLSVNPAFARMFGYSSPDEMISSVKNIGAELYVHPEDREYMVETLRKQDKLEGYEVEVYHKDKSRFWISINIHTVRDDKGRILYFEGTNVDITERKKAEEALRLSEERYRLLAENARDVIWVLDTNLRYVYVSPSVERMRGYTVDEVIQQSIDMIMTPDSYRFALEVFNEELRNEKDGLHQDPFWSRTFEAQLLRKDGSTVWTEITASFLRDNDGRFTGILGISRDISERKKAEEALSQSEERFRRLAEVSPQIFWMASPDWENLIYVSPAFEKIFGMHAETVLQNPRAWLDLIHPEDKDSVLSIFGNNETLDVEYEFRIVRADGTVRWIRNSRSPVLDEKGRVILLVGIAEDITDRIKTNEEHKIYEARLARSQKLEAIGTLAGGIAHDFNNILSAIIGYSELALEDLPEGSPARESLAEVLTAGDRARELVRQILTFSRQVESERKPVRVQLIVKEALKLLRSSIPRTITIVEHIDPKAGPVMADPTQLHQVIMNLCTNAYHAMLPMGGVMTVSVDSVYLDAHFASLHPELEEGNFLKLAVQDSGMGMDADTMKRIFDPFFTTKEKTKGTGLGLSTVHGIIIDLRGTVIVSSEVGSGSTFEVYLPVTDMTDDLEEEPAADLEKGRGETILLVDDEEAILHFTSIMLEQLGYRIIKSSSSIEALRIFQSSPETISLVITDQTMPGLTGADLAAEVLRIRPSMPIILMTGFSEIIGPEEALAQGIEEYLEKPFTRSDVTRAVQKCLARTRENALASKR